MPFSNQRSVTMLGFIGALGVCLAAGLPILLLEPSDNEGKIFPFIVWACASGSLLGTIIYHLFPGWLLAKYRNFSGHLAAKKLRRLSRPKPKCLPQKSAA